MLTKTTIFTVKDQTKDEDSRPRVVIIGGGFAGLALAKKLKGQPVNVLLLDKNNYHTFSPLLYQVAIGAIEADSIAFPIRRVFTTADNLSFNRAVVKSVQPENNSILTSIGVISYDYLILATGSVTNFFGDSQLAYHAMPMKNIPEALNLRSLILQNLEKAIITQNMEEKLALMTFVVVGGGPTGVELAGALAEMRQLILVKDYHGLCPQDMIVFLIEGKKALLSNMSVRASARAKSILIEGHVTVLNGVHVKSYNGLDLLIDNGRVIKTRNVIWAAGVKAALPDGLEKGTRLKGGRLQTDEIGKVNGFDNIFAIGDAAGTVSVAFPNGLPGVAPVAIQQGEHLAKNLVCIIKNESTKSFCYKDKGTMATIGRNQAVADLGRLHLNGFIGWFVWCVVHLMTLAGFTNKGIVFLSWAINYFSKNSDNRLIIRDYTSGPPVVEK